MFEAVILFRMKVSHDLNGVLSNDINWLCASVSLLFCTEVLSYQPMKRMVRIFLLISVLYTIYDVT